MNEFSDKRRYKFYDADQFNFDLINSLNYNVLSLKSLKNLPFKGEMFIKEYLLECFSNFKANPNNVHFKELFTRDLVDFSSKNFGSSLDSLKELAKEKLFECFTKLPNQPQKIEIEKGIDRFLENFSSGKLTDSTKFCQKAKFYTISFKILKKN
jgi:hypothetical protein